MKLCHYDRTQEITGPHKNLSGDLDAIWGDCTAISGQVALIGDVSGLGGDVTGLWGRADGLRGDVQDLADRYLLWPKSQPLTLEMFASRYSLPMEFLDYSSYPALIAFHALETKSEHWLMARPSNADGFIVGPLAEIQERFLGQEVTKIAVPFQWRALRKRRKQKPQEGRKRLFTPAQPVGRWRKVVLISVRPA